MSENDSEDKSNTHSNQTDSTTTTIETTMRKRKQSIIDDTCYDCIPSSSSSSTLLSTTSTQSNKKINNATPTIQSMQHNNNNSNSLLLSLSLDTWDEGRLHYWFSIVLIQGVVQLPLCDLKQCTLICKPISKLARDYIQRHFWFQQHSFVSNVYNESHDPEKRYLWYSPRHFTFVKNAATLPINTTKIQFYPTFNSPLLFPIPLQQVTHITFRFMFNQPIGCGIKSSINNLPLTLTHLEFSSFHDKKICEYISQFNESVDDLPPKLTHLTLGTSFNRSVDHLPPNLTHLSFGWSFDSPISHLPPKLTHLRIGDMFNKNVSELPLSITHLTFMSQTRTFNQPLSQLQKNFESNVEYLAFSDNFQWYEYSVPPNFIRLDVSEQVYVAGYSYTLMVYRKQQK